MLVLFMMVSLVNLMVGCESSKVVNDNNDVIKESVSLEPQTKIADKEELTEDGTACYYSPGNEYFQQVLALMLDNVQVQQVKEYIEADGYDLTEELSFVLEYEENDMPSDYGMVVLTMAPADGNEDRVVYLGAKIRNGIIKDVDAVMMSFGEEPYSEYNDFDFYLDGAWIRDYAPDEAFAGKASGLFGDWLKCTLKGVALGALSSAVGCLVTGPAYGACLAGGTFGSVIVSSIYCVTGSSS